MSGEATPHRLRPRGRRVVYRPRIEPPPPAGVRPPVAPLVQFPCLSGVVQHRQPAAMVHSSDSATESDPRPMSNAMRSEKTSIEVQASDHRKTLIDQKNPDRQEGTKKKGRKARPTPPTLTTQRYPITPMIPYPKLYWLRLAALFRGGSLLCFQ